MGSRMSPVKTSIFAPLILVHDSTGTSLLRYSWRVEALRVKFKKRFKSLRSNVVSGSEVSRL
jgi:hypothetical protein